MLNQLIIIHAINAENLLKYKDKATHWLPEDAVNPPDVDTMYQPPNIICTTKHTVLDVIKLAIQAVTLSYKLVVWIDANNPACVLCYTFDRYGELNNFFKLN